MQPADINHSEAVDIASLWLHHRLSPSNASIRQPHSVTMNASFIATAWRKAVLPRGWLTSLFSVITFLVALAFLVVPARAEIACNGIDLITQMERDDPEALAAIRAEAAEVENGKGLLWKIEKEGVTPSYLFGTMHMSDPRVVRLGAGAQAAFDASSTIIIETTEVLDPAKVMAAMLANPELAMFTDGTTLSSLVPQDEREAFDAALAARGIPPASVEKMKPWMLSAMVALPACEMARKAGGAPVLDAQLARQGEAAGKALGGLETIADQLGAMASLPLEFHIRGLLDTLKLGKTVDDVIETMIVLYLGEDTGMFWPFFHAALPAQEQDSGFAAFEEAMVKARNRTMAERSVPFIDAGGAFIAVGALHLPGPDGLVTLLREKGYRIEAVR